MRILQVIPYFYPLWAYGGSARVAYSISREIVRRGHEVVVYTSNVKDDYSRVTDDVKELDGIHVHCFRNVGLITARKMKLFITPDMFRKVKRDIQRFDVVHLHEYRSFQNVVVHRYARKYGVPYVLQAHGSLPRIMAKQRLKWVYDVFFGYRLLRDASKVIALSRTEAEQYRRMGVPLEKVEVIPNGIDLSEYGNLPPKGAFKKKFSIGDEKKIVLYLGRIHRTKGIDFLITAYARLVNDMKFNDAVLVIAGPDDGYLNKVESLADSLGVTGSVLFTGFVSDEDKLRALVDAEVFVTPSFYGFPVAFLEACAVGTPIVTTTVGDALEWIDYNVGYVTRPVTRDLAEAICRILSDGKLRKKLSGKCRNLARTEFSIKRVVDRLERLYEGIVSG